MCVHVEGTLQVPGARFGAFTAFTALPQCIMEFITEYAARSWSVREITLYTADMPVSALTVYHEDSLVR